MERFKESYGLKITDNADLFLTENNLLEFLMGIGREVMGEVFAGMDDGYEGAITEHNGKRYKFVG
jgi:hypothetical protein